MAQLEIHKRFRRGLDHECYSEGCEFEEVTETIHNSIEAVSSAQIPFISGEIMLLFQVEL